MNDDKSFEFEALGLFVPTYDDFLYLEEIVEFAPLEDNPILNIGNSILESNPNLQNILKLFVDMYLKCDVILENSFKRDKTSAKEQAEHVMGLESGMIFGLGLIATQRYLRSDYDEIEKYTEDIYSNMGVIPCISSSQYDRVVSVATGRAPLDVVSDALIDTSYDLAHFEACEYLFEASYAARIKNRMIERYCDIEQGDQVKTTVRDFTEGFECGFEYALMMSTQSQEQSILDRLEADNTF